MPISNCLHPRIQTGDIDGLAFFSDLIDDAEVPGGLISPLRGTFELVPQDIDIWIFTSPMGSNRFYMESHRNTDPADRLDGDRFVAAATIDTTSEILVVLATPEASAQLSTTLAAWIRAESFPGIPADELPSGLKETDCVTSIRPT